MINHKYQYIFVHISKTGGSSVEHALDPDVKVCSDISGDTGNTHLKGKHWSARQYQEEYPHQYQSYFKFAFVRNPWDRMVSGWKWLTHLRMIDSTFKNWIQDPTYGFNAYSFARMTSDSNGSNGMDYVGTFENLQQDFNSICDKIGIPRQKLPHVNKINRKKHYTEYYNEEAKRIVAEKYGEDIEYFGYKFE